METHPKHYMESDSMPPYKCALPKVDFQVTHKPFFRSSEDPNFNVDFVGLFSKKCMVKQVLPSKGDSAFINNDLSHRIVQLQGHFMK